MAKEEKHAGKKDMQEMMEVYNKLATPGPPHQLLARLAGSLDHPDPGVDGTR